MEDEAKRGRGRPRKDVSTATVASKVVEATTDPDLNAFAMQAQILAQAQMLFKLAQASGTDLSSIFGTPPSAIVQQGQAPAQDRESGGKFTVKNWERGEYDVNDKVTFTPQPIPGLMYPLPDDEGNLKILLTVNDIPCWLTVGMPCTVSRMFYNVYKDSENEWKELQGLLRDGPKGKPWGERTHQGEKTWKYVRGAPTFGMSDEGRWLQNSNTGRNEMYPSGPPAGIE